MKDFINLIAIVTIAISAFCLDVGAEDKIQKEIDYAYQFLQTVVPGDHTDILNATPELRNLGKVSYSTLASIDLYNFRFQTPWTGIKQLSVTDESTIILFDSQVLVAISPPMILPNLFNDLHGALEKNLSDNEMEKVGNAGQYFTPTYIKRTYKTRQKFFDSILMTKLGDISKNNPPGKNLYIATLLMQKSHIVQMPKTERSWDILYKYHFPNTHMNCYQFSKRDFTLTKVVVLTDTDEKIEFLIVAKTADGISQADIDVLIKSISRT